jgi:hypothetical protein
LVRIKNILEAYPYLLRHHIRSSCLCVEPDSVDDQCKLILEEPSKQIVDSRYEGASIVFKLFRSHWHRRQPLGACESISFDRLVVTPRV